MGQVTYLWLGSYKAGNFLLGTLRSSWRVADAYGVRNSCRASRLTYVRYDLFIAHYGHHTA